MTLATRTRMLGSRRRRRGERGPGRTPRVDRREVTRWRCVAPSRPPEHARAATARGSTITVSIIDSWSGPPVFVEAETYKGASPELEREVQQIVDSLRADGGIG